MENRKSALTPPDATSMTERAHLVTQLRTGYKNGETVRTLARSTGRSYGLVHRLLTESGVTMRPRGYQSAS